VVAFNALDGVRIDGGSGTPVLGNAIHHNGGMGIQLGSAGIPAPNDAGDGDTGPNGFQNYPLLAATATISGATVSATLNSKIGVYHLEFFASTVCGRFGYGEGQTLIGSADIATNANGDAVFGPQSFALPPGQYALAATATDSAGNTSEFSACVLTRDVIFTDGFDG
jgi:hypothetical protein